MPKNKTEEDLTYTMHIEKPANVVKPHGFHLGTDLKIAEGFVKEQLRNGAVSVKLFRGNKKVDIYDYRDLEDATV